MESRISKDITVGKIGVLLGTAIGFALFMAPTNEIAVQALPAITFLTVGLIYITEQLVYSPAQFYTLTKGWMTSKDRACTYSAKVSWERAKKFGMRPFAVQVMDGCDEPDFDTSHTYLVVHLGGIIPMIINRPSGLPCKKSSELKIIFGGLWDKRYSINTDVYNYSLEQLD
jgi:hypothetical protein